MSAPREPGSPEIDLPDGVETPVATSGEAEEVDALPVLAPAARVLSGYAGASLSRTRTPSTAIPAVQAAAVAAGGFVAGAAVVGLVHRRHRQAAALSKGRRAGWALGRAGRSGGSERAAELLQIVGSRSLLVDVHLLGGRD